jgi:hypothetical protein
MRHHDSKRLSGSALRGPAFILGMLCWLFAGSAAAQIVYSYESTTTGTIPESAACPTPLERTFVVSDSFTVAAISLGIDLTHTDRGQVRIQIVAPNLAVFTATPGSGGDANDDYRMTLSSNGEGVLNDGDVDPAANSRYRRLVNVPGINFYTGNSAGTWRVRFCDLDTAGAAGTLLRTQLILRDDVGTAVSACGTNLTYDWASNGALNPFVSFSVGGVTLTQTSTSGEAPADVAADPSFITRTTTNGNHPGYYSLHFDTSGENELSAENVIFTFSEAATWLTFSLLDVDRQDNGGGAGWEDYIRVDGFDDAGVQVPKQMTLANAQLQFAGDWVEADATVAQTSTNGNVVVRFVRPVRSLRVEYAAGDDFAGGQVFQVIGLSDFQFCAFDYGDAPDSYNTTIAAGTVTRNTMGARDLFMGTAPDGESDGQASVNADGDGNDEDGVTFPTLIAAPPAVQRWQCGAYLTSVGEYCVSVNTTNNIGATAQLVGWIDFNGDGDFNDANERSLPELAFGTGGAVDNTFATGNVPAGTGTRVLRWTGVNNATSAQTYLRVRLTTDASFFTANPQPNGQLTGGETEDHRIPASTLAVSLNWVESYVDAGQLHIAFSTATESGNVGFSIHEKRGDAYERITSQLLPSRSVDTADVSQYKLQLPQVPASGEFFIGDHDTEGRTTLRGPFTVGEPYGYKVQARTVDWAAVRGSVSADRERRATAGAVQGAKLWVSAAGFHRVTAAQLLAQGVDLAGTPVDQIAISFRGAGVPRRVHPATGVFGSGSYIDFYATEAYSLYTADLPFLLKTDGVGVVRIHGDARTVQDVRPAWYWATVTYTPELIYNFASPTADPWHAARMLAFPGAPSAVDLSLQPTAAASTEFAPVLRADLIGVTNWAGAGQDHHARMRFGGTEVAEASFDGVRAHSVTALLPQLTGGSTQVSIETTGNNGFSYDLIYLDKVELRYPRLPVADADGRLLMRDINADMGSGAEIGADDDGTIGFLSGFEGDDLRPGFVASGLPAGPGVAYAGHGDDWTELTSVSVSGGSAAVPFLPGADAYWVSSTGALRTARVEVLPADEDIVSGNVDYLIISHSLFLDDLADIVALQQSRGLTTRVVDVAQIYQQFGDGLPEADAISAYLRAVATPMGVDYVLLVGADTYDYKNYLGTGSVSLVPTVYSAVGDIAYTPTDAAYADLDGDDVPEFAIGRLPVRSIAELAAIRTKILAVQGSNPQRSVILVAGGSDGELDFSAISDGFAGLLPGIWQSSEAYVDDIGVQRANQALLDELNGGVQMVSYVGHSAPIQWSSANQTVLTSNQVLGLSGGVTDLVVQWGCWNSYFVSPNADTMAHAFLLTPGRGAAAVIGVAGLTGAEAHSALGTALYPHLAPGTRIGDALRAAKSSLAGAAGIHRDILISSTLLGDPAMPIR